MDILSTTTRTVWQELQSVQADSPVLGMQLWHLVAIIVIGISILLTAVCCFIDWRIPRTRKEIELDRQLREMAEKYAGEMMEKMKAEENLVDEVPHKKLPIPVGTGLDGSAPVPVFKV